MGTVTGVISNTNDNYGKVNICVEGKWYSTKKEWWKGPDPVTGMEVTFDDGGRNYIKGFKVSSSGSAPAPTGGSSSPAPARRYEKTFPIAALDPARAINRQNALTNAVNYCSQGEAQVSPDEVIDVARMFEAYTTGDLDAQEVEEAMKAMEG